MQPLQIHTGITDYILYNYMKEKMSFISCILYYILYAIIKIEIFMNN